MALLSKSEIKFIRSLSMKKYRDSSGLFIVEGEKMVQEAIDSDLEIVSVYRTSDIGEEEMSRITNLSSPSPALAVVRKHEALTSVPLPIRGISIALDDVHDPGNMGTILRLSDWFGIENIFASCESVELYNPKTVQASMGAIFRKQVIYIDLHSVISTYLDYGLPVYGTFLDGRNIYKSALDKDKALIVMGSENNGISPRLAQMITSRLYIPPFPPDAHTSESLNVAIATAITLSEFRRG